MIDGGDELIYVNLGGDKLKLVSAVVQTMLNFRQDTVSKPENGGILLGRFILESDDIIVDRITTTMKRDRSSRFRFLRSIFGHQQIADADWQKSGGTTNYLGEWHTHPEPYPLPSSVDLNNWRKLLKKSKYDSDYLFFVIVGLLKIAVWQGFKQTLKIDKLTQVSTEGRLQG